MRDYDVRSTVHLLRQYGFMKRAETHQREHEVKRGLVVSVSLYSQILLNSPQSSARV